MEKYTLFCLLCPKNGLVSYAGFIPVSFFLVYFPTKTSKELLLKTNKQTKIKLINQKNIFTKGDNIFGSA